MLYKLKTLIKFNKKWHIIVRQHALKGECFGIIF